MIFIKMTIFAVTKKSVPWMSGLVSGLQNRARRFDSARNLETARIASVQYEPFFYCSPIFTFSLQKPSNILQCAIMDKVSLLRISQPSTEESRFCG